MVVLCFDIALIQVEVRNLFIQIVNCYWDCRPSMLENGSLERQLVFPESKPWPALFRSVNSLCYVTKISDTDNGVHRQLKKKSISLIRYCFFFFLSRMATCKCEWAM